MFPLTWYMILSEDFYLMILWDERHKSRSPILPRIHREQLIAKYPHMVAESPQVRGLNGRLHIAEGRYRERWSRPVLLEGGPFSVRDVHAAYTWPIRTRHPDSWSIGCTDFTIQVEQRGFPVRWPAEKSVHKQQTSFPHLCYCENQQAQDYKMWWLLGFNAWKTQSPWCRDFACSLMMMAVSWFVFKEVWQQVPARLLQTPAAITTVNNIYNL